MSQSTMFAKSRNNNKLKIARCPSVLFRLQGWGEMRFCWVLLVGLGCWCSTTRSRLSESSDKAIRDPPFSTVSSDDDWPSLDDHPSIREAEQIENHLDHLNNNKKTTSKEKIIKRKMSQIVRRSPRSSASTKMYDKLPQ